MGIPIELSDVRNYTYEVLVESRNNMGIATVCCELVLQYGSKDLALRTYWCDLMIRMSCRWREDRIYGHTELIDYRRQWAIQIREDSLVRHTYVAGREVTHQLQRTYFSEAVLPANDQCQDSQVYLAPHSPLCRRAPS